MEPRERRPSKETRQWVLLLLLSTDAIIEINKEDSSLMNTIPFDGLSKKLRDKMARYNAAIIE